ncbi:hypothetical protein LPB86_14285 [Pedobacter sp. MC2016-14]|uniref:lipopolysaccharide assembly protein LapA domain-containing protein n=1 Tax=Pedobacter sp. MC2016-14 TaxID=2897327 RepID=UPI001E3D72B1|nr:hypothetical protein [Pedobacter sp. MC2016-14]MCD0489407.1 hypothetical protein [Pedobacter sp. MC2016-14]
MRAKTIFTILFTVIITVFLMINTDAVEFNFIFGKAEVSKLLVIGICTFIGFILGYWVGRPRTVISTYDDKFENEKTQAETKGVLSDEDRDYIS